MKNKKTTFIYISIVIIILLIIAIVILKIVPTKQKMNTRGIINLTETNVEIPTFSLNVEGGYIGKINNELLSQENIKIYEFDAGIDTGWNIETNHYTGIKLLDLLKAFEMENYHVIEFISGDSVKIDYQKNEITDNAYLIFYKDGNRLDENLPVTFLSVDNEWRYSVERLSSMSFWYTSDEDLENNTTDESTTNTNEDNNQQ